LGRDLNDLNLVLNIEQARHSNIGLVLDIDHIEKYNGAKVLSVAPGSTASKAGVKTGDLVVSINNNRVNDENIRKIIKQLSTATLNSDILINIVRNGESMELTGTVGSIIIPNAKLIVGAESKQISNTQAVSLEEQCGRVREPFITPKLRESIYYARIQSIDGEDQPRGRDIFKLKPGLHVIGLHEFISDRDVRRKRFGVQYRKFITLKVEPNMTYYVGARFLRNKRMQTRHEKYWEPTIWKEESEPCEL